MQEIMRIYAEKNRVLLILAILLVTPVLFYILSGVEENKKTNQMYATYINENASKDIETLYTQAQEKMQQVEKETEIRGCLDMLSCTQENSVDWEYAQEELNQLKNEYPQAYEKVISEKEYDLESVITWERVYTQLHYLREYKGKYDKMEQNAERLKTLSVFNESDSFSSKNIDKQLADFWFVPYLNNVLVNENTITEWEKYNLPDYLMIIVICVVVLSFFEERHKGLYGMVRSAAGRTRLIWQRLAILILTSAVGMFGLYGITLLQSVILYGNIDWNAPVQSLQLYENCPYLLTIGGCILVTIFIKICCLIVVGCIFWAILVGISQTIVAMLLMSVLLSIQYITYINVGEQSSSAVFKFANIFSMLNVSENLKIYRNVSVANHLVESFVVTVAAAIIAMIIFSLAVVCLNIKVRGSHSNEQKFCVTPFWRKWRVISVVWQEGFKNWFVLKGVFLLLALALFSWYEYKPREVGYSGYNAYVKAYYDELEGRWSEEKVKFLAKELKKVNKQLEDYKEKENSEKSNYDYEIAIMRLEEKFVAVTDVYEEAVRLQEREEQGQKAYFVSPFGYRAILSGSTLNRGQRFLPFMLVLVLMIAGTCAYENQSKTNIMLHVSACGRRKIYSLKWLYCMIVTLLVWGIMTAKELMEAKVMYDYPVRYAPIWNLDVFANSSSDMTLKQAIIYIYIIRFMVMLLISMLCFWISQCCGHVRKAYILCLIVVVLPAAFIVMGVEIMKWVSFLEPLRVVDWIGNIWNC